MAVNQKKVELPAGLETLPLKKIDYEALVQGQQAELAVHQEFGNTLDKPIEAVYVFPLNDESDILEFEMKIGDRVIKGELKERTRARMEYEDMRDAGHAAALLEQERPNIFTVSVSVAPGEKIIATTRVMFPVPWQDDGGRLNLPMVVAPRFIPGKPLDKEPSGGGWSADTDEVPDASKITPNVADAVNYSVSLNLALTPGFACEVASPSHSDKITRQTLNKNETASIVLNDLPPDRDIVITYKTFAERPNVSVYQTKFRVTDKEVEHFVLLQMTAHRRKEALRDRNVVLVLDDSASMGGEKNIGLKHIAKLMLDRFAGKEASQPANIGILAFGNVDYIQTLSPITKINTVHYESLNTLNANSGGTYIGAALTRAMSMFMDANIDPEASECCIIVISDGQSEDKEFRAVSGIRVHTVGIDSAADSDKLKEFSRKTGGHSEFVLPGEDFTGVANSMVGLTTGPVVRGVSLTGLPKGAEVNGLGDLFSGRPVIMAVRSKEPIDEFTVAGRNTDGTRFEEIVKTPKSDTRLAALIWAKNKIRETKNEKELTALSLRYGLLCRVTAFVAVSERVNPTGKPERVEVPVLLPKGWEYDAVFDNSLTNSVPVAGAYRGGHLRRSRVSSLSYCDEVSLGGHTLLMRARGGATARRLTGAEEHLDANAHVDDLCIEESSSLSEEILSEETGDSRSSLSTIPGLLQLAETVITNYTVAGMKALLKELLKKDTDFDSWSELDKARLFEILANLKSTKQLNFDFPMAIMEKPLDVDAYKCWQRAKAYLGESIK